MNKKGIELVWEWLFNAVIICSVFASLFYFIHLQTKGEALARQLLAKEICLIATQAKSGTLIEVNSKGFIIQAKDSGVLVKSSELDPGYLYPCYLKGVDITKRNGVTLIEIK